MSSDANHITPEKVIMAYVATRDKIAEEKRAYEAKVAELEQFQARREAWLQQYIEDNHLKNVATTFGTAYPALKESVTVADWDAVVDYALVEPLVELVADYFGVATEEEAQSVREMLRSTARLHFFNRAVNKTAVLEVMGDLTDGHRENPPIPGVNYTAVRTIQVRKS